MVFDEFLNNLTFVCFPGLLFSLSYIVFYIHSLFYFYILNPRLLCRISRENKKKTRSHRSVNKSHSFLYCTSTSIFYNVTSYYTTLKGSFPSTIFVLYKNSRLQTLVNKIKDLFSLSDDEFWNKDFLCNLLLWFCLHTTNLIISYFTFSSCSEE